MLDKVLMQIEKEFPKSIRLQGLKKVRKETLTEFLIKFFTNWNLKKDTIWVETKERQTPAGKRRSLGDIYMICKYYYPKITLQEVLNELIVNLPAHFDKKGFRTSYCYTYLKRMWYYSEQDPSAVYDAAKYDEYGVSYNSYKKLISKEV